jgi:hypothetical protein
MHPFVDKPFVDKNEIVLNIVFIWRNKNYKKKSSHPPHFLVTMADNLLIKLT